MKLFFITLAWLVCFNSYCQKYQVGLVKSGSAVKNLEGEIVVGDSVVTSTFDGQTSKLKITGRNGYTIHVTDGTTPSKYVVGHHSGRQHGFTYDRSVTYHPPPHHPGVVVSTYYCVIKRD